MAFLRRILLLFAFFPLTTSAGKPKTGGELIESEVRRFEKLLTLEEEATLMSGQSFFTAAIPRLQIPSIAMTDGGLGVVSPKSTAFPANVLMAATWNPDLIRENARHLGREVRLFHRNALLGPCINIHRSPLGGRNFESYSEDPFLAAQMARSFVQGISDEKVIATVKHFALNNLETNRLDLDVRVSERAMHEIYFPAFASAVRAGAWAVMSSYNLINGVYASANNELLNQTLKRDWKFQGYVVSDWGATYKTTTVSSANAGLDLEMPVGYQFAPSALLEAYGRGQIGRSVFRNSARRILRAMIANGILTTPRVHVDVPPLAAQDEIFRASDQSTLSAAREGIVLLKNDFATLPLNVEKITTLAVIGPNAADTPYLGGGSAYVDAREKISALDAIKNELKETPLEIRFARGTKQEWRNNWTPPPAAVEFFRKPLPIMDRFFTFLPSPSPQPRIYQENSTDSPLEQAKMLAGKSDAAIVFVGWNPIEEGEGRDRLIYGISPEQAELVRAIASENPRTIVILNGGSSITMPFADSVPAIVDQWYAGEMGTKAVAEILFGRTNPSGHSPVSFLKDEKDSSDYGRGQDEKHVVHYDEDIFVGYRYLGRYSITPLFPFGHGLTYTNFRFSNLRITRKNKTFIVNFEIENTGSRTGAQVAQLYVGPEASPVDLPPLELKGFTKVALAPGEKRQVSMSVHRSAFAHYNEKTKSFLVRKGRYKIMIGDSSRPSDEDSKLEGAVEL